jgi:hypothetical protein
MLDKVAVYFGDKATSAESGGGANASYTSPGFSINQVGTGLSNNAVFSYKVAANIITDPIRSRINVLTVPGQREPLVTDYFLDKTKDHQLSFYLLDIANYDSSGNRIFDGDTGVYVDVTSTANFFQTRAVDNDAAAAFFPSIVVEDPATKRKVMVPASIAALSAVGFNDKVAYPWYAPAGFNRASLDFVSRTQAKINQPDRNKLSDARINPIVKFPREGYVIYDQKTLKQGQSLLQNINVKRMVLEVKRQCVVVGTNVIFDQITDDLLTNIKKSLETVLAAVQNKNGIENYKVVVTSSDADRNERKINVKVALVPVGAFEIISFIFVIVQSGVQFS